MELKINSVLILATLAVVFVAIGNATSCNECGPENIMCLDESHYHHCMGGRPIGSQQKCEEDLYCTAKGCKSEGEAACKENPSNKKCDVCNANFCCLSQTEFGLFGEDIVLDSCKTDEICNHEFFNTLKTVCIPKCAAEFLNATEDFKDKLSYSCSNEKYIIIPPVPPTDEELKAACEKLPAGKNNEKYAFTNKNCKYYAQCERVGNTVYALRNNCPDGEIFSDAAQECQAGNACPSENITTETTLANILQ